VRTLTSRHVATRRLGHLVAQPPDAFDGLVAWWTPQEVTLVDGRVSVAADLSGNGFDMEQDTAASRPYLVDHDGRVWFDFTQGNHYLSSVGPGPVPAGQRSIAAVIHLPYDAHIGARRAFLESYPNYFGGAMEISASDVLAAHCNDGGLKTVTEPVTFPLRSTEVVGVSMRSGGAHTLFRGDERVSCQRIAGNISTTNQIGFRLGTYRDANGRWFDGYLGDVVIIDRELRLDEWAALIAWFRIEWGAA